jgi:hypothetical protein
MNVTQACEAYNNTLAALSTDGQWLTVRTLKSPEKIAEAAARHGYTVTAVDTDLTGDCPEHTITLRKG